jgi:hypothetical protein
MHLKSTRICSKDILGCDPFEDMFTKTTTPTQQSHHSTNCTNAQTETININNKQKSEDEDMRGTYVQMGGA